jgi:hypothetical protein
MLQCRKIGQDNNAMLLHTRFLVTNALTIFFVPYISQSHHHPNFSTMTTLHCSPHLLIAANAAKPVITLQIPRIVISQPFPIALSTGSATMAPVKENMLRTKLLRAMPDAARLGMNSVSIVLTRLNISIEPTPKKTVAVSVLR